MNSINRRSFLKSSIATTGLLATQQLLPWRSLANVLPTTADHFLLILYPAIGAMDSTLGLDPYVHTASTDQNDMFIEYREDQILRAPNGLRLAPAAAPLLPFADSILPVNGIYMGEQDNGHDAYKVFAQTGYGDGSVSDIALWMAKHSLVGKLGVLRTANLNTRESGVLQTSLDAQMTAINSGSTGGSSAEDTKIVDPHSPFGKSISLIREAVQERRRFFSKARELAGTNTLERKHVVAASFLTGVSVHASLELNLPVNLDTHGNHVGSHLRDQTIVWQNVADWISYFKSLPFGSSGESLFDRTTFLVVTEFSRTPALNGSNGKDHNPLTNSFLLAGYGINNGKVIGKSELLSRAKTGIGRSEYRAVPIDYRTGNPATTPEFADFITPTHVARTIAEIFKIDPLKIPRISEGTRIIPGVLKSTLL